MLGFNRIWFASLIFAIFTVSCGGPGERIREISNSTPQPSPTPGERLVTGQFNVSGSAANQIDPYTGNLIISSQGEVYAFRWTLNSGTRIGTGVQTGDAVAASFAPTGGGKGCGVVLFKIASDGSLDGKIANWGEDKLAIQKATRVEGTGFVGKYNLTEGASGMLTISKNGSGYEFDWKGDKPQVAFGTWKGSVAAASFGGRQCSFALYDIQSNGNLEGNWGGQKAVTFGTETAKRQ